MTVNGRTLGENIEGALVYNDEVIAPREQPARARRAAWRSCAATWPRTAPSSSTPPAEPRLLQHAGPAVVFRNYNDLEARIDDPALPVTADSVLVLQDAGPLGAPGMPEWGMLPIPKKLLAQGVRDMVRISDARMSGTELRGLRPARGARVVRGRAAGLRARRRRDRARRAGAGASTLRVSDEELGRRRAGWKPREVAYPRGYGRLYARHVTQADKGCDFDFLEGTAPIAEPEIH